MTETLTDQALAQARAAGLARPRPPAPGQEWKPRTPAEEHLLREGYRLDRVRLLLLEEVGRLRRQTVRPSRAEVLAAASRKAERMRECPLSPALLAVVAGAAAGETGEETAARLHLSYEAVKTARQRAMSRLQARSMPHAVALVLAHGWLQASDVTTTGGTW